MKRSKQTSSSKSKPLVSPPEIHSQRQLFQLQRLVTTALFRPLTKDSGMQKTWIDGTPTSRVVNQFIKANDRLSSFERLEIYNRQYWFRILDSFYEDYPGLRAVLGDSGFLRMAETYLARFPSHSWTMRNLGLGLVRFLTREPHWAKNKQALAIEVARFEWAQIQAFDAASKSPLNFKTLRSASPDKLRLGLQPHVQLLELTYPVYDFVLAVKVEETVRGQASNAINTAPRTSELKRLPLPKPKVTHVAIHRFQNALYYKQLEPRGYKLLKALQKGYSLEEACMRALRAAPKSTDWQQKVEDWFQTWSALGWFCEYIAVPSETKGASKSQVAQTCASSRSRRSA